MKRLFFTLITLLGAVTAAIAGESASDLLSRAAKSYRDAKSITATYSMTADGHTSSGKITIAGDRFHISSADLTAWYDGKTQWTYSPAINEVNITDPTREELEQINPFAVINAFRRNYKAAWQGNASGKLRKIVLTPNDAKADIRRVTLTINTSTLFPTEIVLTLADKRSLTLRVSSASKGNALPLSTFRFEKSKMPRAAVVDLR